MRKLCFQFLRCRIDWLSAYMMDPKGRRETKRTTFIHDQPAREVTCANCASRFSGSPPSVGMRDLRIESGKCDQASCKGKEMHARGVALIDCAETMHLFPPYPPPISNRPCCTPQNPATDLRPHLLCNLLRKGGPHETIFLHRGSHRCPKCRLAHLIESAQAFNF